MLTLTLIISPSSASEYRAGVAKRRRRDIVAEASRINSRTQEQVLAEIAILQIFQAELEAKADRYREVALGLGVDPAAHTTEM